MLRKCSAAVPKTRGHRRGVQRSSRGARPRIRSPTRRQSSRCARLHASSGRGVSALAEGCCSSGLLPETSPLRSAMWPVLLYVLHRRRRGLDRRRVGRGPEMCGNVANRVLDTGVVSASPGGASNRNPTSLPSKAARAQAVVEIASPPQAKATSEVSSLCLEG